MTDQGSSDASAGFSAGALVDTHAHIENPRLLEQLGAVLNRARQAGVGQIIAIGTTAEDSARTLQIANENPGIFVAVGIHPNDAAEAAPDAWDSVVALVGQPKVVAIGETGLDRYWKRTPFPLQQEWFDRHLTLASERGLPIVIHCRDAQRDIIDQLRRLGRPIRGVMHSFTGTWDDAEACLELGLHVSFAGMITFENKSLDALRDVASRVPVDRLLVETDSPYLSPHPERGKTNEPGRVARTAARLAEIRGIAPGELANLTTVNARRLFAVPHSETI
jgi:TatD DNase family protein